MAFKQELELYLQFVKLEKGLSENSVVAYRNDLERYFSYLQGYKKISDLAGVTLNHIEDFLNYLVDEEMLAAGSLARNISSIRGFHEFAVVEGILTCKMILQKKPKLLLAN